MISGQVGSFGVHGADTRDMMMTWSPWSTVQVAIDPKLLYICVVVATVCVWN